jgi:transposase
MGKKQPISRIIKTFGSGTTPEEINALKTAAQLYLNSLPPLEPLMKKGSSTPLLIRSDFDIDSCYGVNLGYKQVFDKLYLDIFKETGLGLNGGRMLSDLATMRIANPKSKRATSFCCGSYNISLSLESIYKFMDSMTASIINNIQTLAFQNTKRLLNENNEGLEVLFYDLTTLYFETNSKDDLREFGFSKDGKHQHVQIMMALITTKGGLPVGYELFPGNTYEGNTFLPMMKDLIQKYKIEKIVIVADSGLISKENIAGIKELGLEYILGGRVKNGNKDLKKAVFDPQGYTDLTDDLRGKIYTPVILKKKHSKKTPAGQESVSGDSCEKQTKQEEKLDSILIFHSQKRAKKDAFEREKKLEKIKEHVGTSANGKLSGALKAKYVCLSEKSVIEIDEEKLEDAAKYDGFFTLETNMTSVSMVEILGYYKGLWQIEQTFRLSKHNLQVRPIFHHNANRIKAHFAICYVALVLIRTLEHILKKSDCYLPLEQLCSLLNQVCVVKIAQKSKIYSIAQDFPKSLIPIYKTLKIKPPHRFSSA